MPCLGAAGRGYDLRSPLGVTPAALAALALPEPEANTYAARRQRPLTTLLGGLLGLEKPWP